MPSKDPTAFQRVFSRRDLFRDGPLRAVLWSACSSILLCLGLVDLFLLSDLLIHQGRVPISVADREELVNVAGIDVLGGDEGQPREIEGTSLIYKDTGLLPTVWHYRDRVFGRVLAAVFRRCRPLSNNTQALTALVAIAALAGWLRSMMDSRARLLLMNAALGVTTRLRQSIHRQTLRLGPSDLEGGASEQALHLFTNEVDHLREGIYLWASRVGRDPLKAVLLLGLAVTIEPNVAFVCLVPLAGCWYLAERGVRTSAAAKNLAEAHGERELRLLAEGLEKTRLVRGYGMETFEQEQFQKYLQRFQDNSMAALKARAWDRRAIRAVVVLALTFVLWYVGRQVLNQLMTFASAGLMLACFAAAVYPLRNLAHLSADLEPARVGASRIQTYLNQIPEVGQAVGARFLQPLSRMLAFENVSYTTPGRRQLLDGLSLKIPAGRQVAIVASDHLEGLAVACLLPRFIEPSGGRILFDGEDIAWVTLESLRAETIFVGGRDPFLTGTVRENIGGGSTNWSLQEVTEAAKVAHAHNFIQKLSQGYETVIGEHGELLDPGQCFRLGLARAVLRKPAVIVIEEPADPIDDDTKAMLDDAYKRISPGRTVIFLPQRLSTLKRVDEIVLIHRGRLAAIGPHSRLVQSSPLYRHWEYIHFNEFRHEFETA